MKISVIIPSRGRPLKLRTVIRNLQQLESGNHEVVYMVGADSDDPDTIGQAQMLMGPNTKGGLVMVGVFDREPALGSYVNQMSADMPADVYVSLCDDVMILTDGWDQKVAEAVEAKPDGVFWWKCDEKRAATYAIVTEKWRKASGRIFTDYFPFWWDDVWLLHVWMLASEGAWLYVDAELEDRPNNTQRMRDLRFWGEFYVDRQDERIAEANHIREALGWGPRSLEPKQFAEFAQRVTSLSAEFFADADNIEARQGEKGPVFPAYLQAKERAESLMAMNRVGKRAAMTLDRKILDQINEAFPLKEAIA